MYLVGARFDDLENARAAILELRQRLQVEHGDVGLRPLGSLHYEQPANGLLVGGRFRISDVDGVVEILRRHGGEIVFKRAEWRTPRPRSRNGDRSCDRCQSLTRLRR